MHEPIILIICVYILIALTLLAVSGAVIWLLECILPDRMARFWEWLGMEGEDE